MNILLIHSVGADDGPLASRLKAVTAAYGVRLVLPERGPSYDASAGLDEVVREADAALVLVTRGGAHLGFVEHELQSVLQAELPIVALVEGDLTVPGEASTVHVVHFDRNNPSAHEDGLVRALEAISSAKSRKTAKKAAIAVGALVGIALGLLALKVIAPEPDDKLVSLR